MRKLKLGAPRPKPSDSFSLIELLMVMTIIAILAALILAAGNGVITKGLRSRASTEIQAMSTAAEGYKTDNGIYPQSDGTLLTNSGTSYVSADGASSGDEYQLNSELLYQALSGQTNFTSAPISGTKVYMAFKANQIGNPGGPSYAMDPWKHSYGYSTGTTNGSLSPSYPYNGTGFFDLWSTAGVTLTQVGAKPTLTNAWLSNWTQ